MKISQTMDFVPFHAKGSAGFGLLVVVVLLPISAFHAAKVTEIYSGFTSVYQICVKNQYAEKGEKVVSIEEVVLFPAGEEKMARTDQGLRVFLTRSS